MADRQALAKDLPDHCQVPAKNRRMATIYLRWQQPGLKVLLVKPQSVFTGKLNGIPKKYMVPTQIGQARKKEQGQ